VSIILRNLLSINRRSFARNSIASFDTVPIANVQFLSSDSKKKNS
jgi:hypothetical protein